MIVKAYQTAFHRGDGPVLIRPIDIPDERIDSISAEDLPGGMTVKDAILNMAFELGQNDFQPVPERYSVSVGDVIELFGKNYRVKGAGFVELELGEDPTALTGREANTAGYGF